MAKIPDDDLESLISNSDITSRAAAKLRAANRTPASESESAPQKPRGHGAPAPATINLGDDF